MMSLVLSIFPIKTLLGLLGGAGLLGALFVKSKVAKVETQDAKVATVEKLNQDHAVAEKEDAVKTGEDAYAALNADRASDLK